MLKKGSDLAHFRILMTYAPRGDIPGPYAQTAAEIMRRKKDPAFKKIAEALSSPLAGEEGTRLRQQTGR